MKKLFLISILLLLQSCDVASAQTPTGNIVPMATGEKMIGRWTDRWKVVCADSLWLTYGLNPTMIGWTSSYRTVTDAQISGWNALVTFPGFGTSGSTACVGNDSRLSDARNPTAHNQDWSTITTGKPTTLSGYGITDAQATLVSGTNIKTINGTSILGSGDVAISGSAAWGSITGTLSNQTDLNSALSGKQATLVSGTNIKTINGTTILGSGDLVVSGSGGLGYCLNVQAASQSTTTDAQTIYWGGMIVAPSTTANRWRVYIPKSGTIKAVYIYTYSGTAGTAEAWVMNIRKNNTTDTQIASVTLATVDRIWSNVALSISVVAGDYIEIKEVCPTWATNPATVTRCGQIYIE